MATFRGNGMSDDEFDGLDEHSEAGLPIAGDEGNVESSPPFTDADSDMTAVQAKPTAKKRRRAKATSKGGKLSQVSHTATTSRSQHLLRLKPVSRGTMLLISLLNACQIVGRNLDRDKVRLYREMLDTLIPPNIIVIRDQNGKYYIASGHHRVAAALDAGFLEVKCDVYEGTTADALVVGGEENQGPVPMSLAAKKSLLDTILSFGGDQQYNISEMSTMTGLGRHTVAKYVDERNAGGDFIAVAGNMKQDKSPEEQLYDAAKGVVRNIKKHGVDVMVKALELMQPYLREEVLAKIAPKNEA